MQNVSIEEGLEWNRRHDEMCTGQPLTEPQPQPRCPDDGTTLRWTDWGYRCPECLVFVAIPRVP
ncbi:hypothetical protein PBI_SMARTIES_3 [Microbacterium phage Smarties]|uniref:Uncharacterized protein n=1 Tax=Microbacterium phage Ariadne TaxID=2656546 RepID=A0A649VAL7_9CAUD|nr:hypothetical protein QDA10_gp003 [Microbacterium phage Ariadne]QGJ89408.1 hypothetical protein PBI_ARIADNE_3 [Microbacterium phage Ariadne]QGJ91395.1 hypothetical protein PBI_SMARTIES_3 [Microbacterium phage Smarties]